MMDKPPAGPFSSLRKTATAVSKATSRSQVVICHQLFFHQENYSILDRLRKRPSVTPPDKMFYVETFFYPARWPQRWKASLPHSVCHWGIASATNTSSPPHITYIYISVVYFLFSFLFFLFSFLLLLQGVLRVCFFIIIIYIYHCGGVKLSWQHFQLMFYTKDSSYIHMTLEVSCF